MIHRYRQLSAVLLVAACVFAVAACGSSSKSTATGATGAIASSGARPVGLRITASERSCLKKHGVSLPTGGFGGPGRGGSFTKGGTPPKGAKFSARGRRGGRGAVPSNGRGHFSHNSSRLTALKTCGVSFGSGSGGRPGAPAGAPAG